MKTIKARIVESNTPPTLSDTPPDVTPPDKNGQCPEGKIFSALHDGCIPLTKNELEKPAVSTFANAAMDNTKTVVGMAAAPDSPHFMKSGDPMGNKMKQFEAVATLILKTRKEADYPWGKCIDDRLADGYDMDSAKAICGSIKAKSQGSFKREQEAPKYVDYQGEVNPTSGPVADTTQPRPEDEREGPAKTKPPPAVDYSSSGQPEGAPSTIPSVEKPETEIGEEPPKAKPKVTVGTSPSEQADEPCPDGQHRDAEGNCVSDTEEQEEPCADGYHKDDEGNCVPDEPLEERVKRIKAETREAIALGESAKLRKDMAKLETIWVSKYGQLDRQLQKAEAYNRQQDKIMKQQRDTIRNEQMRCEDLRVEMRDIKNQFADATTTTNKYARLIEDLKIENANLNAKYHGSLQKNLELSKKLTSANEEYLDLAKTKEDIEDKFKKARINAKKTLKIQV